MINPFATGLAILTWFLSFTTSYQFIPFAILISLYVVFVTLFTTPVIPRGKLPHLDDIYIRAFFNCFKQNKLSNSQSDFVPAISSAATHLLFSLDTIWSMDASLSPLINKGQSESRIVEYCQQTAPERSQRVYIDQTSKEVEERVATEAKEFITSHIQRIRTIPLAVNPSHYLMPIFNLDSSIQTFLHFPLPIWKAVMTMVDMTIYFPAPRGAQFFFESNIIGLRQLGNRRTDLAIDIQTTISIDRNRLEKLYSEEDEYDKDEREYIAHLQQQDIEIQTQEMEKMGKDQQRRTQERRNRTHRQPEQLVLVARVVTTYVYPDVVNTATWDVSSQPQYPAPPKKVSDNFENIIATIASQQPSQPTPLVTIDTTSQAGTNYAAALGNVHPRMMAGLIPKLFGLGPDVNNQLDVTYATHFALNVYHAMINDTLNAGLSQSKLSKAVISGNDDINQQNKERKENKETIYPYRSILQTLATANAPATIRCYITPQSQHTQNIQHRGLHYSEHLQERLRKQQEKEKTTPETKTDVTLEPLVIPAQISTETFPQFTQQCTVTLTIADGQDEVIWAQGIILTDAKLDDVVPIVE